MGHVIGRCDVLDVLEESAVLHSPVIVELEDGTQFEDRVRDVVTHDGEDFAVFEGHEDIPVSVISDCGRAVPRPDTYGDNRTFHELD